MAKEEVSWQALMGIEGEKVKEDSSLSPVFHRDKWLFLRRHSKDTTDHNETTDDIGFDSKLHSPQSNSESGQDIEEANKNNYLKIANEEVAYYSPIKTRRSQKRKSTDLPLSSSVTVDKPSAKRTKTKKISCSKKISARKKSSELFDITIAVNSETDLNSCGNLQNTSINPCIEARKNLLYSVNEKVPNSSTKTNISDFLNSIIMIDEADKTVIPKKYKPEFPLSSKAFIPVSSLDAETHVSECKNDTPNVLNDSLTNFSFTNIEHCHQPTKSAEEIADDPLKIVEQASKVSGCQHILDTCINSQVSPSAREQSSQSSSNGVTASQRSLFNDSLNYFPCTEVEQAFSRTKIPLLGGALSTHNDLLKAVDNCNNALLPLGGKLESQSTTSEAYREEKSECNYSNNLPTPDETATSNIVNKKSICSNNSKNNSLLRAAEECSLVNLQEKFNQNVNDSINVDGFSTQNVMISLCKPEEISSDRLTTNTQFSKLCKSANKAVAINQQKKQLQSLFTSPDPKIGGLSKELHKQENGVVIKETSNFLQSSKFSHNLASSEQDISQEIDFSVTEHDAKCAKDRNEAVLEDKARLTGNEIKYQTIESKNIVENLLEEILDKPSSTPLERLLSEDFTDLKSTVIQFSTAGGSVVKTSPESLDKAKELLKDVLAEDDNSILSLNAMQEFSKTFHASSDGRGPENAEGFAFQENVKQEDRDTTDIESPKKLNISQLKFPETEETEIGLKEEDKRRKQFCDDVKISSWSGKEKSVSSINLKCQNNIVLDTAAHSSEEILEDDPQPYIHKNNDVSLNTKPEPAYNLVPPPIIIATDSPKEIDNDLKITPKSDLNNEVDMFSQALELMGNFYTGFGKKVTFSNSALSKVKNIFKDIMDDMPETKINGKSNLTANCVAQDVISIPGTSYQSSDIAEDLKAVKSDHENEKSSFGSNKKPAVAKTVIFEGESPLKFTYEVARALSESSNSPASSVNNSEDIQSSSQERNLSHNKSFFDELDFCTENYIPEKLPQIENSIGDTKNILNQQLNHSFLARKIINTPTGTPTGKLKLKNNKKLLSLSTRGKRQSDFSQGGSTPNSQAAKRIKPNTPQKENRLNLQEKLKSVHFEEVAELIIKSPEYELRNKKCLVSEKCSKNDDMQSKSGNYLEKQESNHAQEGLFKTANGDKVNITKRSLRSAKNKFKQELEPDIHKSEADFIVKSPEYDLEKSKSTMFSTAKGNSINISENSLKRVKNIFKDEFDCMGIESIIDDNSSFVTAKHEEVNVSQEILKEVKCHLMDEFQHDMTNISSQNSKSLVHGLEFPPIAMFFTANGGKINISHETLQKVKNIFKDELTADNCEGAIDEVPKIQLASNQIRNNSSNYLENHLDQTGIPLKNDGAAKSISSESLKKTYNHESFQQDHKSPTTISNPILVGSSAESLTVENSPLVENQENEKSFPNEKNISPLINGIGSYETHMEEVDYEKDSKFIVETVIEKCHPVQHVNEDFVFKQPAPLLSTANGKQVPVSKECLQKVKKIFSNELDPACSSDELKLSKLRGTSLKDKSKNVSPKLPSDFGMQPDKYESDADRIVNSPEYDLRQQQAPVLMTANGNSVSISAKSLEKVQNLFNRDVVDADRELKVTKNTTQKSNDEQIVACYQSPVNLCDPPKSVEPCNLHDMESAVKSSLKGMVLTSDSADSTSNFVENPTSKNQLLKEVVKHNQENISLVEDKQGPKNYKMLSECIIKSPEYVIKGKVSGFFTANGKNVNVSEKSLENVKNMFKDEFNEIIDLDYAKSAYTGNVENNKIDTLGEVSSCDNKKENRTLAENSLPIILSDPNYKSNYLSPTFSTAKGTKLCITKESLEKVKNMFKDELGTEYDSLFMGTNVELDRTIGHPSHHSANGSQVSKCESNLLPRNLLKECMDMDLKNPLVKADESMNTGYSISTASGNNINTAEQNIFRPNIVDVPPENVADNRLFEEHINVADCCKVSKKGACGPPKNTASIFKASINTQPTFSTAGGSSVKISEESLQKARMLFLEDVDNVPQNFLVISGNSTNPGCSFSTASGNIKVAEENLLKDPNMSGNLPEIVEDNSKVIKDVGDPSKNIASMEVDNTYQTQLLKVEESLYTGGTLSVSENNLKATNESIERTASTSSADSVRLRGMHNQETFSNNSISVNSGFAFSSAAGRRITVSEESLKIARNLFKEEINDQDNSDKAMGPMGSGFAVSSAGGSNVPVSEESLKRAHNLFGEEINGQEKSSDKAMESANSGFACTSADGSSVSVSEESLKKAYNLFKDEITHKEKSDKTMKPLSSGFAFSSAGGSSVPVSEESLKKAHDLFKDEITRLEKSDKTMKPFGLGFAFSSAGGGSVPVSEESLKRARNLFHEEIISQEKSADKTMELANLGLAFTSAGGSSVSISKESLKKAHNLFMEEMHDQRKSVDKAIGSGNSELMFSSGGGSHVSVSEESLKKAHNLFKDENTHQEKSDNSVNHFCSGFTFSSAGGSSVPVSEESLKRARNLFREEINGQEKSDKAMESANSGLAFASAGGSSVSISKESLKKAYNLFKDEITHKEKSDKTMKPLSSGFAFSSAGGSSVPVSEESLKKAHDLFKDENTHQEKSDNSMNHFCSGFAFSSAGGSSVLVSEESLKRARDLFREEINSQEKSADKAMEPANLGLALTSAGGSSVSISKESLKKAHNLFMEEMHDQRKSVDKAIGSGNSELMFSSGGGNHVSVSEESLKKAHNLFKDENTHQEKSYNSMNHFCSGFTFSSAGGSSVPVSEESLKRARNLFREEINGQEKSDKAMESANSGLAFASAGGSSVSISKESLKRTCNFFCEEINDQDKFSHKAMKSVISGFAFSSAGGSSVPVSEESLNRARNLFREEINGQEKSSDKAMESAISGLAFASAGGSSVPVFKESLNRARNLIQEEIHDQRKLFDTSIGSGNSELTFSSAGGSHVSVSEESLKEARNLFKEEINNQEKSDKPKESVNSGIAFSAAGGSSVTVSEESLEKAQNLMHAGTDANPKCISDAACPSISTGLKKEAVEEFCFSGERGHPYDIVDKCILVINDDSKSNVPLLGMPAGSPKSYNSVQMTPKACNFDQVKSSGTNTHLQGIAFTPTLTGEILYDELNRIEKESHSLKSKPPFPDTPTMCKNRFRNKSVTDSSKVSQKRLFEASTSSQNYQDRNELKLEQFEIKPIVSSPSSFFDRCHVQPMTPCALDFGSDDDILGAAETPIMTDRPSSVSNESIEVGNTEIVNHKRKSVIPKSSDISFKKVKPAEQDPVNFEEILSIRSIKREEQKRKIASNSKNSSSTSHGLYMSIRNEEILYRFMENPLNNPQLLSPEELVEMGLHPDVVSVTSKNAIEFQFDNTFFSHKIFSKSGIIDLGNDFVVILSDSNKLGLDEISAAFLASPNVDPSLVPKEWIKNHYRWIVWKLASLEKSFPHILSGRHLIPVNVLHQLKYRYDREIDLVQRPALRKILECDEPASRRFVACISDMKKLVSDDLDPAIEIELTDGWYGVWSTIDSAMMDLVRKGKVKIGTKLIIQGSELLNCGDGCDPLEPNEGVRLKLSTNSVRRVKWHTKLGFTRNPGPLCVTLDSILPDGGAIGMTTAVVSRVYPMLFLSKDENGKSVVRNSQTENQIAATFEKTRNKISEEHYEKILAEIENKYRKGPANKPDSRQLKLIRNPAALYRIISQEPDLYAFLSSEQLDSVKAYHEEVSKKIQDEVKSVLEEKLKELAPPRQVTSLLKLRIINPETDVHAMLTVWRPTEELISLLAEERCVKFYALTASGMRDKTLQLSSTKLTCYKESRALQGVERFKRRLSHISELSSPINFPVFGELDIAGIVVYVKEPEKPWGITNVYFTDLNDNFMMVTFWTSLKTFGYEDLLKEGSVVAAINLHWRQGSGSYVVPSTFANELTYFTTNPSRDAISSEITSLKNHFLKQDLKSFVESKKEALMRLLKDRGCGATPQGRRSDSLGLSPHIAKRIEKLKSFGPAPPLPRTPLLSSPDIRKGFKSPKINKAPHNRTSV